MEDLNNALNNIESKLEERGIKVKKIRQSNSFYNSNSGLYERTLKITNDNSYQLTPSNRTFNNYNSGRSNNNLNSSRRSNFKPNKIPFRSYRSGEVNNTIIANITFEEDNENDESFSNEKKDNLINKSMMMPTLKKNNSFKNPNRNNRYVNNSINEIDEYKNYDYSILNISKEYETRKLIEHELHPYVNNFQNKMKVELNEFQKSIKDIKNKTNEIENVKDMIDENNNKIERVMDNMDYMNRNFNDFNKQLSENIDLTKKKYYQLEKKFILLKSILINYLLQ